MRGGPKHRRQLEREPAPPVRGRGQQRRDQAQLWSERRLPDLPLQAGDGEPNRPPQVRRRRRTRSAPPRTSRATTRSRTAASRNRIIRRTHRAGCTWCGARSSAATGCATGAPTTAVRRSVPRPTSPRARRSSARRSRPVRPERASPHGGAAAARSAWCRSTPSRSRLGPEAAAGHHAAHAPARFSIGDSTLFPGDGTSFSFNSSEAGVAVLTIQKRVKGMKVRIRGRRRCVPQTRDSPARAAQAAPAATRRSGAGCAGVAARPTSGSGRSGRRCRRDATRFASAAGSPGAGCGRGATALCS